MRKIANCAEHENKCLNNLLNITYLPYFLHVDLKSSVNHRQVAIVFCKVAELTLEKRQKLRGTLPSVHAVLVVRVFMEVCCELD